MMNNIVLDIGSSKVVALAASYAKNGNLITNAQCERKYDGFINGEFIDLDSLKSAINECIRELRARNILINSVYVGVNGEFTTVEVGTSRLQFNKERRVTDKDVFQLQERACNFRNADEFMKLAVVPVSYTLNYEIETINPINSMCSDISAKISYVFADNYFVNTINDILNDNKIKSIKYVPTPLGQACMLIDHEVRDIGAVLIDAGHTSTSVSIIKGDALVMTKSFASGGGFISSDISQVLNVDFATADIAKLKANLNLEFDDEDAYEINGKHKLKAKLVNDVIEARIEDMANRINNCVNVSQEKIEFNSRFFITGGGLCYLKGAVDILSKYMDRVVSIASLPYMQIIRQEYTSCYSILYYISLKR